MNSYVFESMQTYGPLVPYHLQSLGNQILFGFVFPPKLLQFSYSTLNTDKMKI